MLLRDISRCCKEVPLPSKVLWRHWMYCSAASLQQSAHLISIKVSCSSMWLCCIGSLLIYQKVIANRPSLLTVYLLQLLYKAPELQVRVKFSVVTEMSTFLTITQVSSGLKKLYILFFSKCKYLMLRQEPVSPFYDGKCLVLYSLHGLLLRLSEAVVSNFSKSSQTWKDRLKSLGINLHFCGFSFIHLLL